MIARLSRIAYRRATLDAGSQLRRLSVRTGATRLTLRPKDSSGNSKAYRSLSKRRTR